MSKYFKALEKAGKEGTLGERSWSRRAIAPTDESPTAVQQDAASPVRTLRPPGTEGTISKRTNPHLVAFLTPTAFEADPYWTLGHIVEQMHKEAGLCVVAISSPTVGDGKTVIAINLAGVLAQTPEARVLLLEADLRGPSVADYLGLEHTRESGLVDAILDPTLSIQDVVRLCPPYKLAVLPAGRSPISPYEALKSPRLHELLEEARRHYDYIVVDTPPLLPFPDCRLMEPWIDAFFVVIAAHKTSRKLLTEALNVVHPDKIVDLIFNQEDPQGSKYYAYKYYASQSSKGQPKARRRSRRRKTR